jgi:hypothetical protein
MQIKRVDNIMLMSSTLVCVNYSDMKHFNVGFEKVSDNEFKCNACGTVMAIKEPILVHDEKGKLKMQIAVETKQNLHQIEKCEQCKENEATVLRGTKRNGVKTEKLLCDECAENDEE